MSSDMDRFVPHRGRMSLLDKVLEHSEEHCVASVTITSAAPFFQPGLGVPAYVGVEYMAQAVAAYDGAKRTASGGTPTLGFLLGTRRYEALKDYFSEGDTLVMTVRLVVTQGAVASFDCEIAIDDAVVATASLTVYRAEGHDLELPGD